MSKADKHIVKGFENGGATGVEFFGDGKYRKARMDINGESRVVYKIPSTSHLDDSGLFRKGRDYAKRFAKYGVDSLAW